MNNTNDVTDDASSVDPQQRCVLIYTLSGTENDLRSFRELLEPSDGSSYIQLEIEEKQLSPLASKNKKGISTQFRIKCYTRELSMLDKLVGLIKTQLSANAVLLRQVEEIAPATALES